MSGQLTASVDQLLSEASSMLLPQGLVCEALLPKVGVMQSSGKLAKYGNGHLRIENSEKGGRGKFRTVEAISRSTSSYLVEEHGLEDIVTASDYRNVMKPYDAELDVVVGLSSMLMLEKEKLWGDTLTSTSIVTNYTTLSGTAQFSDFNNSDPVSKFATARSTIRSNCGLPPDSAVMDWAVFNQLRFHPQILDSLGFNKARPGGLTVDELAVAMGVKRVLISQAVYNSAKEGQTDSLAAVWGKHIVFGVFPENPSLRQVSVGYNIGYADKVPNQVYKYPSLNPPNGTYVLVENNYDILIHNAGAAYCIRSAIA